MCTCTHTHSCTRAHTHARPLQKQSLSLDQSVPIAHLFQTQDI